MAGVSETPVCTCGVGEAKSHARSCAVVTIPTSTDGVPPYVAAEQPVPVIGTVKGEG